MHSYNPYYNYIAHHGIKGQEWGVKNGPPYPLDDAGSHINYDHKNKKKKVTEIRVEDKKYKEEKKEANKKWKKQIKSNLLKAAVALALVDPVLMIGGFNPIVFPTLAKVLTLPVAAIKAKGIGGLIGKKTAKTSVASIASKPTTKKTISKLMNAGKVIGVGGAGAALTADRILEIGDTRITDIYW